VVEKNQTGGYRLFFLILAVIRVDKKRPYSALSFLTARSYAFFLGLFFQTLELQNFWDGGSIYKGSIQEAGPESAPGEILCKQSWPSDGGSDG
jgi:hypothetical protein